MTIQWIILGITAIKISAVRRIPRHRLSATVPDIVGHCADRLFVLFAETVPLWGGLYFLRGGGE